jgi:hypothetical protein
MVGLTEPADPVCAIHDRRIFIRRRTPGFVWGLKDRPAAWSQHSQEFAHRSPVIRDVFQDVVAEDDIELFVRETQFGDVHALHGQRRLKVNAYVSELRVRFQMALQIGLGCDVKDPVWPIKEVGPVAQIQPDGSMSLEGTASWTARVAARRDSKRAKTSESTPAAWTFVAVAAVCERDDRIDQTAR